MVNNPIFFFFFFFAFFDQVTLDTSCVIFSAIAVTTPLLTVHPREHQVPSKLVGISKFSIDGSKLFSLIIKLRARVAATFKFSSRNSNAFSSKYLTCLTNWDLAMGKDNLRYCKILAIHYVFYRSYVML